MSEESGDILVVDDEPLMRGLLLKALTWRGHLVDLSADGRDAIGRLERKRSDLVITDHSMPRMSGAELIQHLRSKGSQTPVILMTSYSPEELSLPAGGFGRMEFIRKPFGLTELHLLVRKILRGA